MNRKYPLLYANFVDYLKAHGLQSASLEKQAQRFQFPQIEKPPVRQVQQALDRGLAELARFCDDKSCRCREIENVLQTTETRLHVAEERLQTAEVRLKDFRKIPL